MTSWLMTSWLMTHHHVSDVNVSSWSESQEFVWGGSAEDQRSHQLHLHDDRQEMYRPDPIGPEGWGESTLFVHWLLEINETDNWYFELTLICKKNYNVLDSRNNDVLLFSNSFHSFHFTWVFPFFVFCYFILPLHYIYLIYLVTSYFSDSDYNYSQDCTFSHLFILSAI